MRGINNAKNPEAVVEAVAKGRLSDNSHRTKYPTIHCGTYRKGIEQRRS